MQKSEDKAEEEKRIIAELWKKTEKGKKEFGILIGGDIEMELNGSEGEINASEWAKPLTVIYKNKKTIFDFYHTHDEWDSPLSSADIYTFLYIANLRSMTAITEKRKYTIIRTKKTPVVPLDQYDKIVAKYEEYKNGANLLHMVENEYFFYADAFRESLCEATRQLAQEYNFIYKEEEIKA